MDIKKVFLQNPSILLSRTRLKGFFNDVYENDIAKVNLVMYAFDIGILDSFNQSSQLTDFERNKLIVKLIKHYSIVQDAAGWAVDTWISVIDSHVVAAVTKERNYIAAEEIAQKEEAELRAAEEAARLLEELNSQLPSITEDDFKLVDENSAKDEYDSFYVNVNIKKIKERIYVPCGVGNSDNGFFIYGISKAKKCVHRYANVYALVYNYIIRNSKITDEDYPHILNDEVSVFSLDYKNVFRYVIILLQMIKNNYVEDDTVAIRLNGVAEEIKQAVKIINHYSALFCRLIGVKPHIIKLVSSKNGTIIGLEAGKGIHVVDNRESVSNARELWIGQRINYHLSRNNLRDLEYILSEISPFDSFKEGQFEALKSMLASKGHSVCIMPTGSGKSLIYYMVSLLQPLPIFVVTPTDILIKDQIRNLQKFHHFDNVSHLKLTTDNDFSSYEMFNSLLYLTPTTFQNRHLLGKFRHINEDLHVSFVVLDEIHCLSNWGHDFRPEYLMLSKYLNKFLDRTTFLGFTATANYTVVEDIQKQLNVRQENFFSPIAFEKYNISYDFRCVDSTEQMYDTTAQILTELTGRNERTIIFTKNEDIALNVADAVGYEADVFLRSNPSAYHHFADGKCKVLVACEELGIGINFPDIKNIVHFGLPISKNEYVQEIGRAGRANEHVTSYIVYLRDTPDNIHPELLKRRVEIDNISEILDQMNNDYADAYRKLNNNADSKENLLAQLIKFYEKFRDDDRGLYKVPYLMESIETTRKHLYMLFVIGYVNDWYSYSVNNEAMTVDILVDVSCANHYFYLKTENMLNRMKKIASDYFAFMGNNRESIAKITRATTIEAIITIYVEWYYTKYLYHHKEQFFDFLAFMNGNQECDNEKITAEIKEYFTLPFIEIKSDEVYYSNLSLKEVTTKIVQGIGKNTLANIERINSNRYSYKLDYLLFIGGLKINSHFDKNRIERVLSHVSNEERSEVYSAFYMIYGSCKTEGRFVILKYLESADNVIGISFSEFFNRVYVDEKKDLIYYGVIAKGANDRFNRHRGIKNA